MRSLIRAEAALRPVLARRLDPSTFVHLYSRSRSLFLEALKHASLDGGAAPEHPIELFRNGLRFRNDLGNAAGLDKDGELLKFNYLMGAGFAVVGTQLHKPHVGNPLTAWTSRDNPWTPLPHSGSAINNLGLPCKGIEDAIDNIKRFQDSEQPVDFPIGISLMGHPLDPEGERKDTGLYHALEKALPHVDFIEINESCPNIEHDHSTEAMETRVRGVLQRRDAESKYVPVLVKVGDFGDAAATVRFFTELGVDGIVGLNTQKDYANLKSGIDPRDHPLFSYFTGLYGGGVSGRAIKERSLLQAAEISKEIGVQGSPLVPVHVGGIERPEDIFRSRAVAPLRQWYTGFMGAMQRMPLDRVYRQMVGGAPR